MSKPILCLDFDGVIHDYKRGWQNGEIYGDVTPGFWEWAIEAKKHFKLVIYSSRSKTAEGRTVMWSWLKHQWGKWADIPGNDPHMTPHIHYDDFEFAHEKPPAFLQIDDRAITFTGDWHGLDPAALIKFKPWNAA